MKRIHRRIHRLVWVVLPICAALVLLLAWQARQNQPVPTLHAGEL